MAATPNSSGEAPQSELPRGTVKWQAEHAAQSSRNRLERMKAPNPSRSLTAT